MYFLALAQACELMSSATYPYHDQDPVTPGSSFLKQLHRAARQMASSEPVTSTVLFLAKQNMHMQCRISARAPKLQ